MSGDNTLGSWVTATTLITASGGNVYGVPVNGYIFAATTTATSARQTSSSDTSHPTSISASTPISISSSTPISVSSSAPMNVPLNVPPRVGLSSGARAGIGVGITLSILSLCALLTTWCLIRRQRRRALNTHGLIKNVSGFPLNDLSAGERSVYEMDVVLRTPKEIM